MTRGLAPIAVDLVLGRYELDLLHLVWNSLVLQPPLVLVSLNTPVFLDCFLNYYFESVFFLSRCICCIFKKQKKTTSES